MSGPSILLSVRYGLMARNLFRTRFLDTLLGSGASLTVLTPAHGEGYLQKELVGRGIRLMPYPRVRQGRAECIFAALTNALLFGRPGTTRTMTIKWLHLLHEWSWLPFAAKGLAAFFPLHRSSRLRRLVEKLDLRLFRHPEVDSILEAVRPDVVCISDLFGSEIHFLRAAQQRGIPAVAIVKSWDNLTSKTRLRVLPERMTVWSQTMVREARELHFVPLDRVTITGGPNFDFHHRSGWAPVDRRLFLTRLGAPADSRLVVYSPGYKLTYSDDDNLRVIRRCLDRLESPWPIHLHVRKYPKSPQTFGHLRDELGITVEDSGRVVPAWADRVDQTRQEMEHLSNLMHHADLLIQIGSTIAVDAACFDTPIIGYFLHHREPRLSRWDYARRTFELTHNRYLSELGGVRVVRTESEFADAVLRYLRDPTADAEGRRRIVEEIAGPFDGRAGERIAEAVLSAAGSADPKLQIAESLLAEASHA